MKEIIKKYKEAAYDQISSYCLPVKMDGKVCGRLRPITKDILHNDEDIERLTNWRLNAKEWFITQFPVTVSGTKKWLQDRVLELDDRILFLVENEDQTPVGHIGIRHYDEKNKLCEFDNLVRGSTLSSPYFIVHACLALGEWTFNDLNVYATFLRVFSDNQRAIRLYRKLQFQEIQRVPLQMVVEGEVVRWVPVIKEPYYEVKRYLVTMRLKREDYFKLVQEFL